MRLPNVFADYRMSRIADEVRSLGLMFEDRCAKGGGVSIAVLFNRGPSVRAFDRKLLASGFSKDNFDVFTK